MQKKYKNALNFLIFSDFSIVNKNINNLQFKNYLLVQSKKMFYSLNLYTLNKSIRQFIKILLILHRTKKPIYFSVYCQNFFFNLLLNEFVLEKIIKKNIRVQTDNFCKKEKNRDEKIILLIEMSSISIKTIIDMYNTNAFLIIILSLSTQIAEYGCYKINNKLNTLKKTIFFCLLLKFFISKNAKTL